MDAQYQLDYPQIAKRVREARRLAGLTQEQLAEKIDISTNAVAKLENHLMTPSLQTLVNLANVLGMDMNYLLGNEDAPREEETGVDAFLHSQIRRLSQQDKEFLIHVINGLKLYHTQEE